jgi:DNA-binding CsgD family transcriptional regulator
MAVTRWRSSSRTSAEYTCRRRNSLSAALASQAAGAVQLEEQAPAAARASLGAALAAWRALGAPHGEARVRTLLALAHRAEGDEEGAALELQAARRAFAELGAGPDLSRVDALLRRTARAGSADPLTAREREVLTLVASGRTNRAVAAALGVAEKTVARHLANIFAKLALSSRAAATAYAYEHGLVGRSPGPA